MAHRNPIAKASGSANRLWPGIVSKSLREVADRRNLVGRLAESSFTPVFARTPPFHLNRIRSGVRRVRGNLAQQLHQADSILGE